MASVTFSTPRGAFQQHHPVALLQRDISVRAAYIGYALMILFYCERKGHPRVIALYIQQQVLSIAQVGIRPTSPPQHGHLMPVNQMGNKILCGADARRWRDLPYKSGDRLHMRRGPFSYI